MNTEVTPSVDRSSLERFLARARAYIEENPLVVPPQETTLRDLDNRPRTAAPCQVMAAGDCPDEGQTLHCHTCPHAMATLRLFTRAAAQFGFTASQPEAYPGLGVIDILLTTNTGDDRVYADIDGDKNGSLSASVYPTRRPR